MFSKIYKVYFKTQIQVDGKGKNSYHHNIKTTLPADIIADMGITADEPEVVISYDKETKTIRIQKL